MKHSDVVIYLGDWNAKVGGEAYGTVVGRFSLGDRNDRGSRLICEENDLMVANSYFQQHPRRLYTWCSPGDIYRNQIDYILINKRCRNAVKTVKTYPGADIGSDHVPVIMTIRLRLKRLSTNRKQPRRNLEVLRDEILRSRFSVSVSNRYEELMREEPMQEDDSSQVDSM